MKKNDTTWVIYNKGVEMGIAATLGALAIIVLFLLILAVNANAAQMKGDCDGNGAIGIPDIDDYNMFMTGDTVECNGSYIFDMDNNNAIGNPDYDILMELFNGQIHYDTFEASECRPDNTILLVIVDLHNIMPNETYVSICNYIPVWTLANESICNSSGLKLMSYNDTSGLYFNYTIENCVYTAPTIDNGDSNGGSSSSDECSYEGVIRINKNTLCKCVNYNEHCWRSTSAMDTSVSQPKPEEKAEITIEPIIKSESAQETAKEPSNAWVWYLSIIIVIMAIIGILIWYKYGRE